MTSLRIHDYLDRSARNSPDGLAVKYESHSLTYAELHLASGRIASTLNRLGVGPGDRVGIYMTKSVEAVTAIYGILRSGAAYVPLDPTAPPSRISYIVTNCGIRVLLSEAKKRKQLSSIVTATELEQLLILGPDMPPDSLEGVGIIGQTEIDRSDASPSDPATDADDLAFLLYTSGSTGQPKGVMLTHRNCLAFVEWAVAEVGVTEKDRVSSHAPFHFDLSTFDLYGAVIAGAPVILVPQLKAMFPAEVKKLIETEGITVWYSVPSILIMLVEHGGLEPGAFPHLETILFAGEVLPTKYLSRLMALMPHVQFLNLYGPTETNVCTWYRVPAAPPEDGPPIPIGRAIEGVETFVVGPEGTPLPSGQTGELVVHGPTVMKGYWADQERTTQRLVPSPIPRHQGQLVFRTGDLVEEQPDGDYRFLGRRDNQIKSRGYRIELGDIESVVGQHTAVTECAAVAIPDERISNRIECFVASSGPVTAAELVGFCKDRLPKYMIPERFVVLDVMPKTSTGKIDRQGLLALARELTA